MKSLRIVLHQNSANYKKEETIDNKMTYPLPPISTVIGAIHNACGYKEYHKMDVSIQGNYESMHKEPYTDYCFLNSTMDDRGILVKMKNESMLSNAFDRVAKANKSQGSSFRKGVTIHVYNQELLSEYNQLKDLNEHIKDFKDKRIKKALEKIKNRKKDLGAKKKSLDKKSEEYKIVAQREKEIKIYEKTIKDRLKEFEEKNYTKPIGKFRSLTTSLKYYEILNNIDLVMHIKSDEDTLNDILENIYNLKSIGRSEDFVDVKEAKIVELYEGDVDLDSSNSMYLSYEDVREGRILAKPDGDRDVNGTKYYLNKNYKIIDGERIFNKKKVIYTSTVIVEETSENVYVDKDIDKGYIVNFI